jgi:hypothetical protein
MNRDVDEDSSPRVAVVVPEKPAPLQTAGKQIVYNFDDAAPGRLPQRFHAALTGRGAPGTWIVQADPTAPSKPSVLAQTSTDKTDYRFPLAIADDGAFGDVDLSVKFKAISGSVDEAGGLVFRLKDANNYYVVRANALEDNYRLYHVVNGQRKQFAGVRVKVSPGEWHEMRVEAVGNKITCYLDGAKSYRLHLPPNIPVKDFWSLLVYDPQTRSMLQTDQQFPSTGSQKEGLVTNADGSVDVYFGPEAVRGKEANWVQTIPGKGWFVVLRLYGPLEPWFDKTWRPGEIEEYA